MTRRGSILLVAHHSFPGQRPPGTARPHNLSKYLGRAGYDVTVLTSTAGDFQVQESGGPERIHRSGDLLASHLNWRRRGSGREAVDDPVPPPSRLTQLVPDLPAITWLPLALPRALRIARERRIDCVVTTSPPQSIHAIGLALHRRGIPWVADLRDGWRFEPWHDWPTRPQRALDAWLEQRVLSEADRIATVTEPITADLRRRLGVSATTITNGYDPEAAEDDGEPSGLLDPDRHSLVYTGAFNRAHASLSAFGAALEWLVREQPEAAARLEIVIAGPVTSEEWERLAPAARTIAVRRLGGLEHSHALRIQREADSLLLLTPDDRPSAATGKLYEYLGAGRPILVVGAGTQAAEIAGGAGLVVPADDPVRIGEGLADLVQGERSGFDPGSIAEARERYAYPRLAERMAGLIEEARAAHAAR